MIAVVDDGVPNVLRLVTLDGRERARTTLPSPVALGGVGGDMATFADGTTLKALRTDGTVATIGQLPGYKGGRIIVSPDGKQWVWTSFMSSGNTSTSRLVLSSVGAADRTIDTETVTTDPHQLEPYRWTPAGPVYENAASGLGGYYLFEFASGAAWQIDLTTGTKAPLLPATCFVADVAADGTEACFPSGGVFTTSASLRVVWPGRHSLDVPLPKPAFQQTGGVSFEPGATATTIAIGGATGQGATAGQQEHYQTDLLDLGSGALRPFGPPGLRPANGAWAWLADGSLLCYRPAGAFGGAAGIYAVSPDGSVRQVTSSGTPIGVLEM